MRPPGRRRADRSTGSRAGPPRPRSGTWAVASRLRRGGRPTGRRPGRAAGRRPRAFESSGQASGSPSAAYRVTRLVSVPKPEPASATSLATSRSTPLRRSLSAARSSEPVSAAKSHQDGPRPERLAGRAPSASRPWAIRATSARMSGVGSSSRVRPAPRVSLVSAATPSGGSRPRPRPSPGRRSRRAASGPASRSRRAARSWPADSTRTTRASSGRATPTLAAMRVTSAPRSSAARATATPILPVERLPMKRTGSIASAVPPAVTTMCRPTRSASRGAPSRRGGRAAGSGARTGRSPIAATTASTIRGSSASRPTPTCPEASGPTSGSTTV